MKNIITPKRINCKICPRNCKDKSFCGADDEMLIARTGLHYFEEPCISGKTGSGIIFFVGCNLQCVFCQNCEISSKHVIISKEYIGKSFSSLQLADTFRSLESAGASNINFVTGTHFTPQIIAALKIYRPKIPIVWNTSSYEKLDMIDRLSEFVDVWLPDCKFFDSTLSLKYLNTSNYFDIAINAIEHMRVISPWDEFADGIMQKGMIVRHLVMPNCVDDSKKILDALVRITPLPRLSLMSQYLPLGRAKDFSQINRKVTTYEYNKVLEHALSLGFDGYFQDRISANADYVPKWNEYISDETSDI